MDKLENLKLLESEIISADLPLRSNLVFGEGNPDSDVMFIGEAPGFNEDRLCRPFVGRAGKLLDSLIASIKWRREDVYITNIVKRRPPDNRDPLPEEIAAYKPFLTKQIEIIKPPVIVTLGRFAMNYFLPYAKISIDQGKIFKLNGIIIYPVYHPAAALRNPAVMTELKNSFSRLPEIVKSLKSTANPSSTEGPLIRRKTQRSLF